MRKKSTTERGEFKSEISSALFKSDAIKELLLGDTGDMSDDEARKEFKKHVKSHLFIDDTITESDTFIYYDVEMPELHPNIKTCLVHMYIIVHRSQLEEDTEKYNAMGYPGNRADILSQMVEDILINDMKVSHSFGIGTINLDSIEIYNAMHYYGCKMTFSVPNFR